MTGSTLWSVKRTAAVERFRLENEPRKTVNRTFTYIYTRSAAAEVATR